MDESMMEENIPQAKLVAKYEKLHARGIVGMWAVRFGGTIAVITVAHDSAKLLFAQENREDDSMTLEEKLELETWRSAIHSADCSQNGQYVVATGIDGVIHETFLQNSVELSTVEPGYLEAVHVAIKPDSTDFTTSAFSGYLKDMKFDSQIPVRQEKYQSVKQISCMRYSHDGKYLAIGHLDGGIEMLHADTFKLYRKYEVHSMRVRKIEFLYEDDRFLSGCDDHLIKMNSLNDFGVDGDQTRTTKAIRIYSAHDSPVTGLTVDTKSLGTRFASSSASSQIFIWHIELTTPIMSVINEHTTAIRGLTFSPTSRHLFSGGDSGLILVYKVPGVGEDSPIPETVYPEVQTTEETYYEQENEPPSEYSQTAEAQGYTGQEDDMQEYQQEIAPNTQYQEYNPYAEPRTPPQEDDDIGDYVYNTTEQTNYTATPPENEYDPAA